MMRIHILFFLLTTFLVDSCGNGENPTKFFEIQLEGRKKQFQNGDLAGIAIKNKKEKDIKKVTYFLEGREIETTNGKITLASPTLGSKVLKARVDYEDTFVEIEKNIRILSKTPPQVYTYTILNTYPHDKKAFTQGLEFHGDTLYESTGNPNNVSKSVLRKLNFETGKIYEEVDLDKSVFGEGLTIFGDKVIQLTWKSGIGYTYNASTLERQGSFSYGNSKEGWGLCNDGKVIYKSDGTEKIWKLNPDTLTEQGYIETVTNKSIFNKANELEYANGKIYANVWQKESMMIINPETGAIEGVINFGGLKDKVEQHSNLDVLNGIAYHPKRKTFFVTGKNWDTLFEVEILKK
ncbi:MAG: glutaminyl-peptide cyclotransferase [Bacteroidota bacterium]